MYCVKHWARIETEGAPKHFFKPTSALVTADFQGVNGANIDTAEIEIEGNVFHAGNTAEDIAMVRNQGLMADDDNKPAPENVPTPGTVAVDNECTWGCDGTCNRKITGAVNHRPSISTLHGLILETASYVLSFSSSFPEGLLRRSSSIRRTCSLRMI